MNKLPIFLMLSLSMVGCGLKMDAIIRHPLHVGVVDQPNTIQHRNGWQSTLLRLDPEAMCFDVTFSAEEANQTPDVSLQSQRLLMNSDREWYDDAYIAEERQPMVTSRQGSVAVQQQVGSSTECVRRDTQTQQCDRWEEQPIYRTYYEPATFYNAVGGGVVCFPNQGRVTTTSERVVFGINRVNFRWGLEDMTQPQEESSGGESAQN